MSQETGYAEFVQGLELDSVSLVECSAIRHKGTEFDDAPVEIATGSRLLGSELGYRFEVQCRPLDVEGDLVAELKVVFVTSFTSAQELPQDSPYLTQFGADVATMAAYPYIREALQGLASRLDLPNFTLGLLHRSELSLEPEPEAEGTSEAASQAGD